MRILLGVFLICISLELKAIEQSQQFLKRNITEREKRLICAAFNGNMCMATHLVGLEKTPDASLMVRNPALLSQRQTHNAHGCFYLYDADEDVIKRIRKFPFYVPGRIACDVDSLLLSPDGKRLIVGFPSKTYVYNPKSCKVKYSLPSFIQSVISPDGKLMVSYGDVHKESIIKQYLFDPSVLEQALMVHDLKKGRLISRINCLNYKVDSSEIAITPDNSQVLISLGLDLYLYDTQTGNVLKKVFEDREKIKIENLEYCIYGQIKISPDGKKAVALGTYSKKFAKGDIILDVFDLEKETKVSNIRFNFDEFDLCQNNKCCVSFAIMPDNENLVVWPHENNKASLFDMNTGELISTSVLEDGEVIVDLESNGTLVCYKK